MNLENSSGRLLIKALIRTLQNSWTIGQRIAIYLTKKIFPGCVTLYPAFGQIHATQVLFHAQPCSIVRDDLDGIALICAIDNKAWQGHTRTRIDCGRVDQRPQEEVNKAKESDVSISRGAPPSYLKSKDGRNEAW